MPTSLSRYIDRKKNEDQRRKQRQWFSMQPGEKTVLEFLPEFGPVMKDFDGDGVAETLRYEYNVIDLNNKADGPKPWDLSKTWSQDIDYLLKQGHHILKKKEESTISHLLLLLLPLALLQRHKLIYFSLISIENFFFDDPAITPENPWKPLPKHSLEQSPCYPIIGKHNKYRVPFYYCKLHPDIENIYLESIEHHCKFSDPELHKSEILSLLKEILTNHNAKEFCFDASNKSQSGKWIPLDKETGLPHQCH